MQMHEAVKAARNEGPHGMDAEPTPQGRNDADELAALIEAGGFWRLAPKWVPRGPGDATRSTLLDVQAGLRRLVDE